MFDVCQLYLQRRNLVVTLGVELVEQVEHTGDLGLASLGQMSLPSYRFLKKIRFSFPSNLKGAFSK